MRLINADELRKCAIHCEIHNGALTDLCVPLYQIDSAPIVDAYTIEDVRDLIGLLEKRPTGEWVTDDAGNITCSNCGFSLGSKIAKLLYPFDFPYCPNCGADMKKGEKK